MRPGQVTRKRARSVSVPASDGYDPPREDRRPNPRLTRPPTDRSLRPKTRSVTDREAAHRFDSDSDSLMKTKHFRKRRNIVPTETGIKRQKCAAIALGVHFTHTLITTAKSTEYAHRDVRFFNKPYYLLNRFVVTGGDCITWRHG